MLVTAGSYFSGTAHMLCAFGAGLRAAAVVADDVAMAAGTAAGAGANLSVHEATTAMDAISTTKSVVADAYHGVDVIDVVAATGVVRLAAAASEDLAGWVLEGGGGALPSESTTPIANLVRTSSRRLPLLEFANNSFDECGTYVAWRGKVQFLEVWLLCLGDFGSGAHLLGRMELPSLGDV